VAELPPLPLPTLSQMEVISATPILALESGRTTPIGHEGGSATPKTGLGVAAHTHTYIFLKKCLK
jgi:hypothetical protein